MTLNRKIQPEVLPPGLITLPKPEQMRLSNGIPVYLFDSGIQDVVSVEMVFRAGSWHQNKPFTSLATNLMLREGTRFQSAAQISETLDYYGAHFENTAERDNAYVALYSLNKHLDHTLPLLRSIVREPVFPESEFAVLAGKQRQILGVNQQKGSFLARVHFNALLFGETHPYGIFLQPGDIERVKSSDLVEFHRRHYHSGSCSLFISGKIKPGMMQMLEDYFGDMQWGGEADVQKAFPDPQPQTREHFIRKEGAVQSAIRMGGLMFGRSHPDFAGLKVLNAVLGGYFGSRLMANLREDKGYTYGIGSAVVPLRHSGYFVLSAEVGAGVTRQAVNEIRSELSRLCDEQVSENELTLVRNYLAGEMLRAVDGPFAQAGLFRELTEDGLELSHFSDLIATVRDISPQRLRDLAQQYLDPAKLLTLVVGPEEMD
jgi:zinc protease